MSTTTQQIFELAMGLADQLSETDGTIVTADTNAYKYRVPAILNILQAEVMKTGDVYSTHNISHYPTANMLGRGFDIITEYEGAEITKECDGSAKAYYFEVDGEGTVVLEDFTTVWNTLASVVVPNTVTGFTAYSGLLTPTAGATRSRIRLTGSYRYLAKNLALFSAPFATGKVPIYRKWYKHTLPADFKGREQVVEEYCENYTDGFNCKWEGKDLYINYEFEGSIRLVYRPILTTLATISSAVQVDDNTARTVLPYGLAMELFKEENPDMAAHFKQRYNELKESMFIKRAEMPTKILDVY